MIAEVTTELEPEIEEIVESEAIAEITIESELAIENAEEIVELEAIAEITIESEPELENAQEIIELAAIAELEIESEPEIVEIVESEAIAEVITELEPEIVEIPEEIVSQFDADFDIDAEIEKMIAEEEAAKFANRLDLQPEIGIEAENELPAIAVNVSSIEEFEDELMALNIYTEKILENYLTDESIDDIQENLGASENVNKTDQQENKVKPHQVLIEEFLVDKYLAKLEELGKADKLKPENDHE